MFYTYSELLNRLSLLIWIKAKTRYLHPCLALNVWDGQKTLDLPISVIFLIPPVLSPSPGTQTRCTASQSSTRPGLASQVQRSCKPHWLGSVIHTHYYFTSSGTTALTAPVSPALIREKAPPRLTALHLYSLPSHAAARWGHTHTHLWLQTNK